MLKFRVAFRSQDGKTKRLVFDRLDKPNHFVVVKLFDKDLPRTVKYWQGDLEKTIAQWRTSIQFRPSEAELDLAIHTIEDLTPPDAIRRRIARPLSRNAALLDFTNHDAARRDLLSRLKTRRQVDK